MTQAGTIGVDARSDPSPQILLVGVGAQKSATTWLYEQLAAHSAVRVPLTKEVNYWNTFRSPFNLTQRERCRVALNAMDGPFGLRRVARRVLKPSAHPKREALAAHTRLLADRADHLAYLEYLEADRSGAAVVVDMSPNYALLTRRTFAEISTIFPDVRFVFIMRDPVRRLVSGVNYMARHYAKSLEDREKAAELMFVEALERPWSADYLFSRYDLTIENLEAAVPRDRILYLFYERLQNDASRRQVEDFLSLSSPMPWETQRRANAQSQRQWRPNAEQNEAAHSRLRETYDFIRQRFGKAVPEEWQRSRESDQ